MEEKRHDISQAISDGIARFVLGIVGVLFLMWVVGLSLTVVVFLVAVPIFAILGIKQRFEDEREIEWLPWE